MLKYNEFKNCFNWYNWTDAPVYYMGIKFPSMKEFLKQNNLIGNYFVYTARSGIFKRTTEYYQIFLNPSDEEKIR